jgi:hypothetical protein
VDDRSLEYIPPPQMSTPDGTSDAPPAPATSSTAGPSPLEPSAAAASAGERPSPSPSRTEQVRYWAQLMPTVAFDAAPATTFGSDAGLSARYRRVSIGLDVRTDLPASKDVGQGASVSTWLVLASLVPCFFVQPTVLLCAMGGAGVFTESGHGLASPRTQSALFLTAGGRLAFEVPLGERFFFVSHGDALVAITRHDVVVDGIGAGGTGAGKAIARSRPSRGTPRSSPTASSPRSARPSPSRRCISWDATPRRAPGRSDSRPLIREACFFRSCAIPSRLSKCCKCCAARVRLRASDRARAPRTGPSPWGCRG